MLDYKYTESSTKFKFQIKGQIKEFKGITSLGYIQMYTSVHSNVSRESYSFELFDIPLDVSLV